MKKLFGVFFLLLFIAAHAYAAGDGVERITVDALKARLDKGADTVVLDARSRPSYEASRVRIKGAVRIPVDELDKRAGELPMGKEIVAYCT